jgi:hypothetical protein
MRTLVSSVNSQRHRILTYCSIISSLQSETIQALGYCLSAPHQIFNVPYLRLRTNANDGCTVCDFHFVWSSH